MYKRQEYVWSPAADERFGNLVLSRLPVEDSQILTLERIDGTQDRSVAIAVSYTHLTLPTSDLV